MVDPRAFALATVAVVALSSAAAAADLLPPPPLEPPPPIVSPIWAAGTCAATSGVGFNNRPSFARRPMRSPPASPPATARTPRTEFPDALAQSAPVRHRRRLSGQQLVPRRRHRRIARRRGASRVWKSCNDSSAAGSAYNQSVRRLLPRQPVLLSAAWSTAMPISAPGTASRRYVGAGVGVAYNQLLRRHRHRLRSFANSARRRGVLRHRRLFQQRQPRPISPGR